MPKFETGENVNIFKVKLPRKKKKKFNKMVLAFKKKVFNIDLYKEFEELENYEFNSIKLDNGIVVSPEMNENLNKFKNK